MTTKSTAIRMLYWRILFSVRNVNSTATFNELFGKHTPLEIIKDRTTHPHTRDAREKSQ